MASKLYIHEVKSDWSGKVERVVEEAWYGPFSEDEIVERVNDSYADLLAGGGAEIDAEYLTDEAAAKIYINPREFWMSQLNTIQFITA